MTLLLGVDTGGTYTDAVLLDETADQVICKAKALTSRPDLAQGVGAAIDGVLGAVDPADVGLVSLSTTLATNALVEGQGGRAALVFIGFDEADLDRGGLRAALGDDPVILLQGGHSHAGTEVAPLDVGKLRQALAGLPAGIAGVAVAAQFATRNPAHEQAARDVIRQVTGLPVTCSHELSAALGGPKRALTALLNARLVGMIDRLISAVETHLVARRISARLMVVRGDGALIPAKVAREKPIETILSGPAASLAGALWLTGETDALVSDIGGTTTDICLLQDGRPRIDPDGAAVGGLRTMVEAVAMRTTGLGGDSAVHLAEGLAGGIVLGPRRVMPVSLLAQSHPDVVHPALDAALAQPVALADGTGFVVPLWTEPPAGLDSREQTIVGRLASGPLRLAEAVVARNETPALARLQARGLVLVAGVTPSDAAHVLGLLDDWDSSAAQKALSLLARRRIGGGDRLAHDAPALAQMIVDQMTRQTVDAVLQTAFAEDSRDWPSGLSDHPLTDAGLDQHSGLIAMSLRLGVPVIGLGASAHSYYPAVGTRLRTRMILPDHADVANAIGAVVGQVRMHASGAVTAGGAGRFIAHLPTGPVSFDQADAALAALETALTQTATDKATTAGVVSPRVTVSRDLKEAQVDGQRVLIAANLRAEAVGRPRIAHEEWAHDIVRRTLE